MRITRRTVLIGASAGATLACGGLPAAPVPPEPAPAPVPEPPAPPVGEPGTLFRPTGDGQMPRVAFVTPPAWFRDAPGMYCPAPRTAGSVLLLFAQKGSLALCDHIRHFRELPTLLEQARALGTDVLYLVDWYEGRKGDVCADYAWNKGDYLPRADLGGAKAFKEGLAAVRKAGGRVLLYLEPFVVNKGSPLGIKQGKALSILTESGYPDDPYPDDWKVCPANPAWVKHVVSTAERMVADYGANGIHLDSFGYQRGWKCVEAAHGHPPGDGAVFDDGCKELVAKVHAAITAIDPEAVLMCEGPKMPGLLRHVSASQDWGIHELVGRPQWDQAGRTQISTAGWNLDDLHQIVALGHRLSLGGRYWFEAPEEPSAVAWLEKNLPDPFQDKKDARFRRFFGETFFLAMHRYRNAGLLLGRPMPNIDAAAPRRWERKESFESREGLVAILDETRAAAERLDRALEGADELPAPTAHVQNLMKARAAFAKALPGATLKALETRSPHAAAWQFTGASGLAASAVNVHHEPLTLTLSLQPGTWHELVGGGELAGRSGKVELTVPGHSVRLLVRA